MSSGGANKNFSNRCRRFYWV